MTNYQNSKRSMKQENTCNLMDPNPWISDFLLICDSGCLEYYQLFFSPEFDIIQIIIILFLIYLPICKRDKIT